MKVRDELGEGDGVRGMLASWLEVPPEKTSVERREDGREILRVGEYKFGVCRASGSGAAVVAQAARLARSFTGPGEAISLVVVPFMGETGRRICEEQRVSWMDLSGNARIAGPGLRVLIAGRPNKFKRPGRPGNVFAPKSARIARRLLIEPRRAFSQRELARAVGLDEGFTSRILKGLTAQELVVREPDGRVRVADFALLLDAWREVYDFSKHRIVRGHLPVRSADEAVSVLDRELGDAGVRCAATGMAAAWMMDAFAGFRLVTFYADRLPPDEVRDKLGFREVDRGENVWLVVPNDEGVFDGAGERGGIRCVHPVQVYLDLKNHPERAPEAAERLRKQLLHA